MPADRNVPLRLSRPSDRLFGPVAGALLTAGLLIIGGLQITLHDWWSVAATAFLAVNTAYLAWATQPVSRADHAARADVQRGRGARNAGAGREQMTQLRRHSLIESATNTAIGYGLAVATQAIVFPWFGIHVTGGQGAGLAAIFTVVSLARGYALRRVFTRLTERRERPLAECIPEF